MSVECLYDGCAVADTGRCALENDPETCPNRVRNQSDEPTPSGETEYTDPVLEAPAETPSFPHSRTLAPSTVNGLMKNRYVTVVGILGDPESGKTACLASLYLLVSSGQLPGWDFADSRSLMGLEEIARGARVWSEGHPPEQMTLHTEMSDDRQPGFLHLRLRRQSDGRVVDLALPDLPGEWTKDLIRTSQVDRFSFLQAADVLWLVLDGRKLENRELRQGTITRLGQLAGRLKGLVQTQMPEMIVVLTHRDSAEPSAEVLARLADELAKHEVTATVLQVAPFSDNDETPPGFGIASLIDHSASDAKSPAPFWPTSPANLSDRSFQKLRG